MVTVTSESPLASLPMTYYVRSPEPPCVHTEEVVEVTYTLVLLWHSEMHLEQPNSGKGAQLSSISICRGFAFNKAGRVPTNASCYLNMQTWEVT